MASTFTTGFGIEKIGSGEQSGTWGTTTNHNLDIVDRIASYKAVALSGTTHTLTVREASPGSGTENLQDGMYRVIKFTGALGANNTVTIAPNTAPAYFIIENATTDSGSSGPYSVILTQGSGANVTVQNGKNAIVYCDGAGSGAAVVDALADLQVGTLEVTGAAAIDGAATLGSTLAVTGALTQSGASQFNSTITAGVDDTGYDVKFFGDTASRYWLWDTSADGVVQRGTLTVGVDDTGHDVKFFGATSGSYWLWDESADGVVQIGALTVGVDDAGHDVKFFGNTASAYMLWDASTDDLILGGAAKLGIGETAPLSLLHVKSADAGSATISADQDEALFEGSGNVGITILGGASNVMGLYFGDAADPDIGSVRYDNDSNAMKFYTNAGVRFQLSSTGGITQTSTAGGHIAFNSGAVDSDFRIASANNTHMFALDAALNRVGIGTGSPTSIFHLYDSTSGGDAQMYVETATASTGARIHLKSPNAAGANYHTIGSFNGSTATWRIGGTGTSDQIDFQTGSGYTTRASINSSGLTVTGSVVATTDTDTSNTGSVTLDFTANQNFVLTFTGNVTLANPSTERVGASGVIVCIQDGTGSRTLSLDSQYKTSGDAGITLSTGANDVDIIPYFVQAADNILLGAVQKDFVGA